MILGSGESWGGSGTSINVENNHPARHSTSLLGRASVRHILSLGTALAILWILLSGYFAPLLLGLGLLSVALTLYIAHRMDIADHEGHPIHLSSRIFLYWPWLLWEIVKANLDVARAIISPKMPLHLSLFTVTASQKTELGHTLYANSITLTPGTVTVGLDGNTLTVHALLNSAKEGLETGDMDRRCAQVEEKGV